MFIKQYLQYLIISYTVAILFEINANFFFDGKLFQQPLWGIGFIIWYGFIYSIMFIIFKNKKLIQPVVTGAIFGTIAEYFIFNRLHIIFDPIIYAIMFFIPFWIYHKHIKKNKTI